MELSYEELDGQDARLIDAAALLTSEENKHVYSPWDGNDLVELFGIALYRVAVFEPEENKMVAFTTTLIEEDAYWLAYSYVAAEYRQQGIYRNLYNIRIRHLNDHWEAGSLDDDREILACCNNIEIQNFLMRNRWEASHHVDIGRRSCTVLRCLR